MCYCLTDQPARSGADPGFLKRGAESAKPELTIKDTMHPRIEGEAEPWTDGKAQEKTGGVSVNPSSENF